MTVRRCGAVHDPRLGPSLGGERRPRHASRRCTRSELRWRPGIPEGRAACPVRCHGPQNRRLAAGAAWKCRRRPRVGPCRPARRAAGRMTRGCRRDPGNAPEARGPGRKSACRGQTRGPAGRDARVGLGNRGRGDLLAPRRRVSHCTDGSCPDPRLRSGHGTQAGGEVRASAAGGLQPGCGEPHPRWLPGADVEHPLSCVRAGAGAAYGQTVTVGSNPAAGGLEPGRSPPTVPWPRSWRQSRVSRRNHGGG